MATDLITLGGGDFGRKVSIRSVQPVVVFELVKYLEYVSTLKLLFASSDPNVNHPGRIVLSRPNRCNL